MKFIISLFIMLLFSISSYAETSIPVGVYLSMTGPVAAWGTIEWQGIKVAQKLKPEVNGKKIKLILEDAASHPESSALSVEKLAEKGVKFVIGPVSSTNAAAALPILEKNKIINIIPSANGLNLMKNKKFALRVCFTNDIQAKIMVKYINSLGYKKGVIIEDISQDYSVDLTKFFQNYFKKYGTILKVYKIDGTLKDFSALATNIESLHPDFVYTTTYYNKIALLARSLRRYNKSIKIFSGSAASSKALISVGGKSVEGIIFTDDFDPLSPQNGIATKFIKLYKKTYGKLPDSPEALAADSYLFLLDIMEKSNFNTQKAADMIKDISFSGITGKIKIKNGKTYRTAILREVRNGSFVPISVFQPSEK